MNYQIKRSGNVVFIEFETVSVFQLKVPGAVRFECARFGPFRDFLKFDLKFDELDGYRITPITAASFVELTVEANPSETESEQKNFEPELIDRSRPEALLGNFRCELPRLGEIFAVSADTLRACLQPHWLGNATIHLQSEESQKFVSKWRGRTTDDVILDGARRDREVWIGDLLPEIRTVYAAFGDTEVIENSLDVFFDQVREDGNLPSSSISHCEFLEYNCWFVVVFYEYLLLSGRTEYLEKHAGTMKRVLDYVESCVTDDCIEVGEHCTWAWTLARKGRVTSSNCVACRAFDCGAELFAGEPERAERYRKIAERIRMRIELAFDPGEGLLRDCIGGGDRYTLDSNSLAVLWKLTPHSSEILANAERRFFHPFGARNVSPKEPEKDHNWIHNDHIWPFSVGLYAEALLSAGEIGRALEVIERTWGHMLDCGARTFWEIIDGNGGGFMRRRLVPADDDRDTWNSACHGWSAGLPLLFQTYLSGVRPISPGYRIAEFSPADLDFEAEIVCGFGTIRVRSDQTAETGDRRFRLNIPAGVTLVNRCGTLRDESGGKVLAGGRLDSGEYRTEAEYRRAAE